MEISSNVAKRTHSPGAWVECNADNDLSILSWTTIVFVFFISFAFIVFGMNMVCHATFCGRNMKRQLHVQYYFPLSPYTTMRF